MATRTHSNLYYVRSILSQTWHHPSNRHRRLRAVAAALGWQVHKRLHRGARDVDFFGWRLRCHPDSNSASNVIYFTELYDVDEMGFIRAYLRPGDGFVDVGANIGTYALLARSLVGPDGLVVAFEPHPVAAARCRENVALNAITNIEVHEAAVADAPGTAEFLDDFDVSNRIRSDSDGPVATRTVQMVALDDVLGDRPMALGKLDVEGHETAALRGSGPAAATGRPAGLADRDLRPPAREGRHDPRGARGAAGRARLRPRRVRPRRRPAVPDRGRAPGEQCLGHPPRRT